MSYTGLLLTMDLFPQVGACGSVKHRNDVKGTAV